MNDFTEIENELKKLQPRQPSAELFQRVENAIACHAEAERRRVDLSREEKIVRPDRFRANWLSLGVGLAAAAVLLIFVRLDLRNSRKKPEIASTSSVAGASHSEAATERSTLPASEFVPAGATQVVYDTRDEGLHFPAGSEEPVRRLRSHMRETLRWQNPATGASLLVSYPSEQVELIPVSGQ